MNGFTNSCCPVRDDPLSGRCTLHMKLRDPLADKCTLHTETERFAGLQMHSMYSLQMKLSDQLAGRLTLQMKLSDQRAGRLTIHSIQMKLSDPLDR